MRIFEQSKAYIYRMNLIFSLVFLSSALVLLLLSPDRFLPALLDGATKSGTLCFSLLASYAVWLGLMRVWEDSGVSKKVSTLLRPLAKRLFLTEDEKTLDAVCMNLSVNLIGISGAATPYGIQSAQLLDKTENAEYASALFFVLNATSLQLIPTSIIGVRVALGSTAPALVVLPTLLTTAFSTLLGVLLTRLLIPVRRARSTPFFSKKQGAGTR